MAEFALGPSELKFTELVWENEPLNSGNLAKLALEKFGWKKSTSYTVLKNLVIKGYLINDNSIVSARISSKEYYHMISFQFVRDYFGGSVPDFMAAYRDGIQLTRDELYDIYTAIRQYNEREE